MMHGYAHVKQNCLEMLSFETCFWWACMHALTVAKNIFLSLGSVTWLSSNNWGLFPRDGTLGPCGN